MRQKLLGVLMPSSVFLTQIRGSTSRFKSCRPWSSWLAEGNGCCHRLALGAVSVPQEEHWVLCLYPRRSTGC